jgi:uncharacterized protein (TIGR00730 family)
MALNPPKAYNNLEFLNSPAARHIRILCEYEETRQRFLRHGVRHTLVFFGSARIRPQAEADANLRHAREQAAANPGDDDAAARLQRASAVVKLSPYYDAATELARRLTEWSISREGKRSYYVTSGGGPGIMEAANRGAAQVPGGRSLGLGISLPFEQGVNEFVTPELAFEFHYFFTRKLWFLYLCKGMCIFPGGFGTMDELFETLTLLQTGKVKKHLPIVMFGTEYWGRILHLEAMAEFGTISPRDLELLHRTDSVDSAFEFLTGTLEAIEAEDRAR